MSVHALTHWDLIAAALLVLLLGAASIWLQLGLQSQLLVATLRMVAQLLLIGFVLRVLFATTNPLWIVLMAAVMLMVAAREVVQRQTLRLAYKPSFAGALVALLLSCVSVLLLTLLVFIGNQPWYAPRYAIPIFGMLLGNGMTGVALALNTLMQNVVNRRAEIEQRLMLGANRQSAMSDIQITSIRNAMIPTINAMATAGVVSLPGMMTGQILAGTPPLQAVKYQILIMFVIAASTGFAVMLALWFGARALFDERQRLRLDRLTPDGHT
ncbi:MAG: iron export ABC transporter permease subunit FetB [Gammaproteobacteria bacterium]|nr:iron export ABC transporter permease subunit FetB [Gammaproteobacteria bacterium]